MSESNAEQNRFPCPGCSAGMEFDQFDPGTKSLKCAYCGTAVAVRRDALHKP
ncbi:MAG: hypothetical protein JNL98_14665 [Bryobacterales bacterium]|nr:hypothetical protein [Bryobacterales bacterium]